MADSIKVITWVKMRNETYIENGKRISYQNSPSDKQNKWKGQFLGTNWGVSPEAYYNYFKKDPTVEIMKGMTVQTAAKIYTKNYWNGKNFDLIESDCLAYQFFDHYIHKGNLVYLKTVLKFKYNFFNPNAKTSMTLEEVRGINQLDSPAFYADIQAARVRAYKEDSKNLPDFKQRPYNVQYEKKKPKLYQPKSGVKNSRSVWDWLSSSFIDKKFRI